MIMADTDTNGGLLSGWNNFWAAGDPSKMDPNTGLSEAQSKQLMFNQLGSLGALLMAAGQRQMPTERAKIIAQMGNIPGQAQQQASQLMQQRLLKLQTQKAQTELDREGRIANDISSNLNSIPDALRPFAQANPVEFAKIQASAKLAQMYRNPTEYDQKMTAALAATGGDRELAAKLVAGAVKIEKDSVGNLMMVDVTTGKTTRLSGGSSVADYGLPPNPSAPMTPPQQALTAASSVPYQATTTAPAWAREGYDPTATTAPVAPPAANSSASISPNLPYKDMFGFPGTYNRFFGKVQDLIEGRMTGQVGAVADAASKYAQARNDIIGALGVDIPGKNLKATQARISELLPQDAQLFRGPSESLKDFTAARDMLNSQIKDLYNIVESPNYARDKKQEAATAIQQLTRGRDNLSVMISQMTGKAAAGTSSKPQAPAFNRSDLEAEARRRGLIQ